VSSGRDTLPISSRRVSSFPAGLAIRAALHSLPEPRDIEAADTRRLLDELVELQVAYLERLLVR
jgi:hypothetical protein